MEKTEVLRTLSPAQVLEIADLEQPHSFEAWDPDLKDIVSWCNVCGASLYVTETAITIHEPECSKDNPEPWWEAWKRYDRSRQRGVKDEAVALPYEAREADIKAAKAEHVFAARHNLDRTDSRGGGDKGIDFVLEDGRTIDVKWTPRTNGRLIQKTTTKWSPDLYVLITGEDYRERGYATSEHLKSKQMWLGRGPVFARDQSELRPIDDLF